MPTQHRHLMTQHEQFDILRRLATTPSHYQSEQHPEHHIQTREEHPAMMPNPRSYAGAEVLEPHSRGDDHAATRLVEIPVAWAEEQFRSMGRHDARDLAVEFIASYQRTAVLTQALREPALLSREGRRLERWIDSLDTTE